ncbi:XRE family transcriptional regulator [Nocardioides oleivorans]|uniref:XRE family transcriptional regulator n=1 Tax=Nocardioides oleivorans TaxID=273676 RepID=A0A4Q2RT87_9ACTN|nr:helix-turn-helix transcriptional regulator [Nocardioides oleivorans]RYB91009.1 XRE family transcriptional regulator [Nocardioides oleivorans]
MTDIDGNPLSPWERNFIVHMARLRESHGMTQTDLAKRLQPYGLKFHQQTIQRVEAGERPVRLNEAHIIARVLESDLNVMTTDVGSSDASIRYAVAACRTKGESLFYNLTEDMNSWLDEFDQLALLIAERDLSTELSEGTVWALEWCWRIREVAAHMMDTRAQLGEFVLGKSDAELQVEVPAFDLAGEWIEVHLDKTRHLAEMTPAALMALLEPTDG